MGRQQAAQRRVGDRYTLGAPLGRGGMGTVWRAHDDLLQRDVAVKHVAVPPGLDEAEREAVQKRVRREARAAAGLSHPALVTVFDVVEEDGDHDVYIVMELVPAGTLADHVARHGPMGPEQAAAIALELVGALEAAHHQGIVHRDVKPSNVLLPAPGAVKLGDFGIASVKDHPSITGTGQVLGSPSYMAPEQAEGGDSGPEADWWGLGATLYFAVEGRPPFDRQGALATIAAVVHEDPPEPARAGPLAPLLERLLAKDPAARPSAAELRRELRAMISRPPTAPPSNPPAPPPSPRGPAAPAPAAPPAAAPTAALRGGPAGRRPPAAAIAVGSALALVVLALVVLALVVAAGRDERGDGTGAAPGPSSTAADRHAARGQGVPADWATYRDPRTGYRVAHPPTWTVRPLDGTRTDIEDPSTGTYLRIDWTDTPGDSPEAAWRALSERFGARHQAYREIRIEPTTYKGFDAAVWEYAYSAGGARLHAVDLGFVTGRYGFALNFQSGEDRWGQSQGTFEAFKASFQVPR